MVPRLTFLQQCQSRVIEFESNSRIPEASAACWSWTQKADTSPISIHHYMLKYSNTFSAHTSVLLLHFHSQGSNPNISNMNKRADRSSPANNYHLHSDSSSMYIYWIPIETDALSNIINHIFNKHNYIHVFTNPKRINHILESNSSSFTQLNTFLQF